MHLPHPWLRVVFLGCLALAAAGCATVQPGRPGHGQPAADQAKTVYQAFLANQAKNANVAAFSLSGSMSFAARGKSGRLNYRFYGNLANPVRLDLTTPMGGSYAHLREDATEFAAYVPSRDTVYRHVDTKAGAARLGMPLPFSLRELAAILVGRFGELAPAKYASAKAVQDGYEYAFSGDPRLSSLTLDFAGKPRHLTGRGVEPWRVDFEDDVAVAGLAVPVAQRIVLTTPGGNNVTIRVKSLTGRPSPYPAADLELPVPPHAATRSLESPDSGALLPEL